MEFHPIDHRNGFTGDAGVVTDLLDHAAFFKTINEGLRRVAAGIKHGTRASHRLRQLQLLSLEIDEAAQTGGPKSRGKTV